MVKKSPLLFGLSVLAIAKDVLRIDGLSAHDIASALEAAGIACTAAQVQKAFARAGNKISAARDEMDTKYKVMIPGRQLVDPILGGDQIEIVLIQGGRPRTARQTLAKILGQLGSSVDVTDPWYGERTLDILEMMPAGCRVRFLTARTNERQDKLSRAIADFKKEHDNVELRVYPDAREPHDRYILTDEQLLIAGHGIKDIGNKESFLVAIERSLTPDLLDSIRGTFESRWARSGVL